MTQWRSPAFRLFCTDCEQLPGPSLQWWYSNEPHVQSQVSGPHDAEAMVLMYSKGLIKDTTLVCASEITGQAPSLHALNSALLGGPRPPGGQAHGYPPAQHSAGLESWPPSAPQPSSPLSIELNTYKSLGYWFTYLELLANNSKAPSPTSGTPARANSSGPTGAPLLQPATGSSATPRYGASSGAPAPAAPPRAAASAAKWKSLLFQLFMQRHRPPTLCGSWWHLDSRCSMSGPCDGEDMVLLYAVGGISDQTAVCYKGPSEKARMELPRNTSVFRRLGSLFQMVQQGMRPRAEDFMLQVNPSQLALAANAGQPVTVPVSPLGHPGGQQQVMMSVPVQVQQMQQVQQQQQMHLQASLQQQQQPQQLGIMFRQSPPQQQQQQQMPRPAQLQAPQGITLKVTNAPVVNGNTILLPAQLQQLIADHNLQMVDKRVQAAVVAANQHAAANAQLVHQLTLVNGSGVQPATLHDAVMRLQLQQNRGGQGARARNPGPPKAVAAAEPGWAGCTSQKPRTT